MVPIFGAILYSNRRRSDGQAKDTAPSYPLPPVFRGLAPNEIFVE